MQASVAKSVTGLAFVALVQLMGCYAKGAVPRSDIARSGDSTSLAELDCLRIQAADSNSVALEPLEVGRYDLVATASTGPRTGKSLRGAFVLRSLTEADSASKCRSDGACYALPIGGFAGDFAALGARYPDAPLESDSTLQQLFATIDAPEHGLRLFSRTRLHDGLYFVVIRRGANSFSGDWFSYQGQRKINGHFCAVHAD